MCVCDYIIFLAISGTDKTDNLTCEIFMIISHMKINAFQSIIASGHFILVENL